MKNIKKRTRHILGISGGKDSAALAVYLRDKIPEMEYVFCDTGHELKETYLYIEKLEAFLNSRIVRLPRDLEEYSEDYDFDFWLEMFRNFLPNANSRWCTKNLKLQPFKKYIGEGDVVNYVGIRADEQRLGYITKQSNVSTVFPFVEDGIDKNGVIDILNNANLGLPSYYSWRSRSGCYFCFFQTKKEWLGLKKNHPDLYEKAKSYEKDGYKWREDLSLGELGKLTESDLISANTTHTSPRLRNILDEDYEDEDNEKPCLICHL